MECRSGIDEEIKNREKCNSVYKLPEEHKVDERVKKLRRYITRCTALLLILVMAFFTGCGNGAQADSVEITESIETTENVKPSEESIKNDEVDITHETTETQEEEAVNDSEKVEANYDINLSPAEVYELFLNGGLTVELEEEQVTVDELFWENDIEYCFGDIDGDGSEELHIRDDVVYYVIKARDGILQIFFEGWWGYEPIITDEACGILYYPDNKYAYETIKFITITVNGSKESEGEFRWNDGNKNGIMDEEDYYSKDYPHYEEIDMEQYVQYREGQIVKQAGNKLEWTDKRLKNFATWQEAYIDFMNKPKSTIWLDGDDYWGKYSLIYMDGDDIPELYIDTGFPISGEFVISFYDGKVRALNRTRGGIQYMEYGGLCYSGLGNMGFYPWNVYMLEKGEFSEIGTGWISENYDAEKGYLDYDYFWEGSLMTKEKYEECLNKLIDTSKCIEPNELYTKDEILEILGGK